MAEEKSKESKSVNKRKNTNTEKRANIEKRADNKRRANEGKITDSKNKGSEKGADKSKRRKRPAKRSKSAEQLVIDHMDDKLRKGTPAVKEANVMAAKDPTYQGMGRTKAKARDIALALLAVVTGSLSTVSILIPNGLTIGGITGIVRIIQNYTGWNYSLIYYSFSVVIMLIVWFSLGIKELRKIILMSIAYPTVMFFLELKNIVLLKSDDLLLISIFCGVLFGISGGLTFKAGFSSGGADSLAKVIKFHYLPHVGINDITFVLNSIVVVASAFVFGVNIALYAIIITYTQMRVGEAVMFGLSGKLVELEIIPGDAEALTEYVMKELGRGVSSAEVTGEYTGEKRKQLKILCSPRESFLIKRYLAHHDPKSFVSVTAVKSVWGTGRGFSDIHKIDD